MSNDPVSDALDERPWRVLDDGKIVQLLASGVPPKAGDWAHRELDGKSQWETVGSIEAGVYQRSPKHLAEEERAYGLTVWREVGHRQVYLVAEANVMGQPLAVVDGDGALRLLQEEEAAEGVEPVQVDVCQRSGWLVCLNLDAVRLAADRVDWSLGSAQLVVRRVVVDEATYLSIPTGGAL